MGSPRTANRCATSSIASSEIKEGFIRRQDFVTALDMLSITCLYTHITI